MAEDLGTPSTARREHQAGDLARAEKRYQEVLRTDPDHAEARFHLGNVFLQKGELELAASAYRRALEVQPDHADAHYNLGCVLKQQGNFEPAAASFRRVVEIQPDDAEAHNNLGTVLHEQDRLEEAAACYRRSLEIRPDNAEVHYNLANALGGLGRLDEAAAGYRTALELKSDFAEAHNNLGNTLKRQGQLDEAAASYRRALQIEPDRMLWELRLASLCPAVFADSQQIDRYRSRLLADTERFAERDFSLDLAQLASSGAEPPFNLMYHGRDDRPIKEAYARIFRRCFPQQTPPGGTGRPRVGFVVTRGHENIFLHFMRGVLDRLDADRLEPLVVCSQAAAGRIRDAVCNDAVGILPLPERFDRMVEVIRSARFDLLYYWEIGSDSTNYFLPFFRLAPVQCTSAGVPVTSGIPQVDYYLSSELWETEGAESRYTERLIRAKTNLVYVPRTLPSQPLKPRGAFGFSKDLHIYLCAQKIEKFHPDFDALLGDILRRDTAGAVVIVKDPQEHAAVALRRRFAVTIPDVVDRIALLPRLTFGDYLSLIAAADVLLDTLHYGGGSTTYHGLSLGKPIVTLPSPLQAGRSTYACYRKMGIADGIASDPDQYVDVAVRLATDIDYRTAVAGQIRASCPLLFEDIEAVRELERILLELIARAKESPP
ncbi:MAG TPA: tetratricopeptide repeat protein [Thermoguttaceae bacterium]|nr:tetratricopeptide repeat protein [Thermoguttaceae bacterium]